MVISNVTNQADPIIAAVLAVCENVDNETYHSGTDWGALLGHSKLLCGRGETTTAVMAYRAEHPDTSKSDALVQGALFHDTLEQYIPGGDIILPCAYTISPYDDFRTKEARTWKADQEAAGVQVIKQAVWDNVREMVKALVQHPAIKKLFGMPQIREGAFRAELAGLQVKIKPDLLVMTNTGLVCVDYKTAESVAPERFGRKAFDYGYHLQSWLYCEILTQLTGLPVKFLFAAVEKEAPYAMAAYLANEA